MSILVFGKTGQVASELQLQADVISLSRTDANLLDINACVEKIYQLHPEVVINTAAYTAVDKAEEDEQKATWINSVAPAAMAKAAAELEIPFLHVSTDYVFDGSGQTGWGPDDPTGPLGAYGRSKLTGEAGVVAAGGNFAILRTSWVFSAFGDNFLKTMLRLGKEHGNINIVADQTGGPTPAAAIAAALLNMSEQMKEKRNLGGIYHFSGGPDISWAGFAREIFTQAHLDIAVSEIETKDFPTRALRPKNSRLDCRTLTQKFGIVRPNWRQGIANVLEQLR